MQTHNLSEFRQAAAKFVLGLKPLPDRATVVGLYGELGAGKTAFVQAAAAALGVGVHVSSPTFLILKRYQLSRHLSPSLEGEIQKGCLFSTLVHVDAYRLKNSDELRTLGFQELLADPANLIFIEWADRVADIVPPNHLKIFFEFVGKNIRNIIIH